MKSNEELAKGRMKSLQARKTCISLWQKLGGELNERGPPTKQVHEWKKTWSDIKYKVKNKLSFNKINRKITGGGPFKEKKISELEEDVIRCAGLEPAVEGIKTARRFGKAPTYISNTQTLNDNESTSTYTNNTKEINENEKENNQNNQNNVEIGEDNDEIFINLDAVANTSIGNTEPILIAEPIRASKKDQKQVLMKKYVQQTEDTNNNIKKLINVAEDLVKYSKRSYQVQEEALKLKKRKLEIYEKEVKKSLELKNIEIEAKLEENRLKRLEVEGL